MAFSFDTLGGKVSFLAYKTSALNFKLLGRYYHLRSLFSAKANVGIKIRKIVKYRIEASWPIMINGCSTG